MAYIVIGSANAHKIEEFKELLGEQDVEIKSLIDFPGCPDIEENGKTFQENAAIKAIAASKYTEAPAFADDSGLEVEALDNEPGIYSARYADTNDARIQKVLTKLEGQENRKARFVCVIAIAFNGEVIETFEGEIRGTIIDAPRGEHGFGYDPIFVPEGYTETFAEMPADLKNKISHRANAFKKATEFIEEELSFLNDII